MEMDGPSACELLADVAKVVFPIIMQCGIQQRERIAGQVGTRLGQIAQESFLGYEMDGKAEHAAVNLLHTLLVICTFPDPGGSQTTPKQAYSRIVGLLRPGSRSKLQKSVFSFFKNGHGLPSSAKDQCDRFLAQLNEEDADHKTAQDELSPGTRIPEPYKYPQHVSENLFNLLHQHAGCQLGHAQSVHHAKLPHPARLHLDGTSHLQSKHAQFELVVSTTDMSYWQDLWVEIPTQTMSGRRNVRFEDMSSDEDEDEDEALSELDKVDPDYFCQILRDPLFAKIKVQFVHGVGLVSIPPPSPLERFLCPGQGLPLCTAVESYKLTDKDKIILAHSIAHSFWQFYGSDLMQTRWTSHDIWFMHESDDHQNPKDQLALRAYISLDFEGENGVSENMDNPMITHPFPHILALGIIMLEIGLRRPFRSMGHLPLASRLNRDHGAAKQLLNELENGEWARATNKDIFTKVVTSCLDPSNFTTTPGPRRKPAARSKTNAANYITSGEPQIDERRRRLYNKVVEPLARLVNIAFQRDPRYISYLSRCKDAEETHKQIQPQAASFHTGKSIVPHEWLDNLKHISRHIMRLRSQKRDAKFVPVKIAILDTGYDPKLPFFKQTGRANCIRGWRDFVRNGEERQDGYGHGSLMARLAMESAPLAQVHIARVAKDTDELSCSKEHIAEAIRWAGLEEEVDIIAMAFGFPHHDEKIAQAIEDVQRGRNVVFLASAGNNAAYQTETFPARHRSVISIRATNCEGAFSASNPPIFDPGTASVLGTFGDDLPDSIRNEISGHFGPSICSPGSSIATAVAAGIAASTIAYAEALSAVLPIPPDQSPVQRLTSTDGMLRMLEKMAPEQTGRYRFVNPIWFWSEKADAWKAWAAMYDSVSQLMYQRG